MKEFINSKTGVKYYLPTLKDIEEAIADYSGFCLACGTVADGVEPDARRYECECCGASKVYGAEECALMGWVA
jgi:hypothetical protein